MRDKLSGPFWLNEGHLCQPLADPHHHHHNMLLLSCWILSLDVSLHLLHLLQTLRRSKDRNSGSSPHQPRSCFRRSECGCRTPRLSTESPRTAALSGSLCPFRGPSGLRDSILRPMRGSCSDRRRLLLLQMWCPNAGSRQVMVLCHHRPTFLFLSFAATNWGGNVFSVYVHTCSLNLFFCPQLSPPRDLRRGIRGMAAVWTHWPTPRRSSRVPGSGVSFELFHMMKPYPLTPHLAPWRPVSPFPRFSVLPPTATPLSPPMSVASSFVRPSALPP